MTKDERRAIGGLARAKALTSEERKAIASKASLARWGKSLPAATYEGSFPLGGAQVSCAVLPDETRIIAQADFLRSLGRSRSPKAGTGVLSTVDELPFFLQAEILKPYITNELVSSTKPIFYLTKSGGRGVGYDARVLPQVAEVYLRYRDEMLASGKEVPLRYQRMVRAADILIRGLASVGIIALVDEATGYQRDRASDALSKILEAFIAKELQPYVPTFPTDFYEEMFRLRDIPFPGTVKRPQYFGMLTNDIVYKRLAPGVLEELKRVKLEAGKSRDKLFQRLTSNIGYPKLREHLGSIVTMMKLSNGWHDFMEKLDRLHPRYGETLQLPLTYKKEDDSGKGL